MALPLALPALAQEADTTATPAADLNRVALQLDSIHTEAEDTLSLLKYTYDSINHLGDREESRLQHVIDSLTTLDLPAGRFTARLDSLHQWKEQKLDSIHTKTDRFREKTIGRIDKLDVPPELKDQAHELTKGLGEFDIALPGARLNVARLQLNTSLPGLGGAPTIDGLQIPGANAVVP